MECDESDVTPDETLTTNDSEPDNSLQGVRSVKTTRNLSCGRKKKRQFDQLYRIRKTIDNVTQNKGSKKTTAKGKSKRKIKNDPKEETEIRSNNNLISNEYTNMFKQEDGGEYSCVCGCVFTKLLKLKEVSMFCFSIVCTPIS